MSFETGILAGIAAGAATALRSVRTAIANFSSILIVQTTVCTPLSTRNAMKVFLRVVSPLPNGIKGYDLVTQTRRSGHSVVVPWIMNNCSGFGFYKRSLIRFSEENGDFKLYSLRWLTNIEELVCELAEQMEKRLVTSAPSCYSVTDIIGMDAKSDLANFVGRGGARETNDVPTPASQRGAQVAGDRFLRFSSLSEFQDPEDADTFELLSYPDSVMAEVEKIRKWSQRREWYVQKGIPYRRGWLLYGPGGTGKSTLAVATAQMLRVRIFRFFLGTLSDQEFLTQWNKVSSERCIILFEDFDGVFHGRKNVSGSTLSFDVLLNAISGVSPADGVLLIITTNKIECIDPALGVNSENSISTRPGRIDAITYVGPLEEPQIRSVASRMLGEWPDEVESVVKKALSMSSCTGAQLREICVQRAFELSE